MADEENDKNALIEQASCQEKDNLTTLEFPYNIQSTDSKIGLKFLKMSRIIQKIKSILAYLWTQCPGFMVIFYLCYLYFEEFIFIILSLLSVVAFLYTAQDSLLYQPNVPANSRDFVMSPAQFNLSFEDLFLTTKDGVLIHAYFIKQPQPSTAPTLLVLHGNAGNIGHRLYNCQLLYEQCHVNIMLLEYRGYGRSQGTPSEDGLVTDATTALGHLISRNDINHSRIFIFGRSLGGAVTIATTTRLLSDPIEPTQFPSSSSSSSSASIYPPFSPLGGSFPAGLLLENTFTSIRDMANNIIKFPLVSYVPEVFIRNKFNSLKDITRLHLPVMFISGEKDEIVPPKMMHSLYEKSSSPLKSFHTMVGGSHNECWRLPGYFEHISNFLLKVGPPKQPA